ncbi:MAG: TlpA family protein disulfide reductase [Phycisphaerales bacterium]|nr:MAG: TlpA family protein disulfide reductase [Phycisphaerales bacterium]
MSAAMILVGCAASKSPSERSNDTNTTGPAGSVQQLVESEPAGTPAPSASSVKTHDIPRFAINSPFDAEYKSPVPQKQKQLWARSCLWEKAPDFVVEKWLTSEPDTKGKYVLIEFWATWCRQCRRAIPKLNQLHRRFGGELVVIGISDEKEQTVRKFDEPNIEYFAAIDTRARMKEQLGVFGIPHIIILEPDGYVVWEGFPLLRGYELTEEVVGTILEAGRKGRAGAVGSP